MIQITRQLRAASRTLVGTSVRRVSTTGRLLRGKEVENCRKVDCSRPKERVKARKIPGCEETPSQPAKRRLCRPADPCASQPKRKRHTWEYLEELNMLLAGLLLAAYITYHYLRRGGEMAIADMRMKINKLDNKLKQLEGTDDDHKHVDGNEPVDEDGQKTIQKGDVQKPVKKDGKSVKPVDQKTSIKDDQTPDRKDNKRSADKGDKKEEIHVKPDEPEEDSDDN